MKHYAFFIVLAFAGITACSTPEVAIDPSLQAEAMPVKGRNGLQIGQVISYGHFETDKVRRGWTRSYDVPFRVRFRGAREKLSFTQYGPGGKEAEVACISKFKSTELNVLGDYFSVPLDLKSYFAGNIITSNADWDFIVYNPNGDFLRGEASAGYVRSGDKRIEISALRRLQDAKPSFVDKLAIYGHEFRIDGKVVGAVSTINRGKVWLDASLDSETRLALAAVATGLLLRRDVESES